MNRFFLIVTAIAFTLILAARAHAAEKIRSFDVCRIEQQDAGYKCQHIRGKNSYVKLRNFRSVDRWMAIPCKQLKKVLPEVNCKRTLGEQRMGRPMEE